MRRPSSFPIALVSLVFQRHTPSRTRNARLAVTCLAAMLFSAACDSTSPTPPVVQLAFIPIHHSGGSAAVRSGVRIYAGYAEVLLVDSLAITHQATGSQVVLTRDSTGFAAAAALLTNGVDDRLSVGLVTGLAGSGGGGMSSRDESRFLEGRIEGSVPPDLQGLSIERITVEIDVATIMSPGRDPNGDGVWTDYTVTGRILVEGWP